MVLAVVSGTEDALIVVLEIVELRGSLARRIVEVVSVVVVVVEVVVVVLGKNSQNSKTSQKYCGVIHRTFGFNLKTSITRLT